MSKDGCVRVRQLWIWLLNLTNVPSVRIKLGFVFYYVLITQHSKLKHPHIPPSILYFSEESYDVVTELRSKCTYTIIYIYKLFIATGMISTSCSKCFIHKIIYVYKSVDGFVFRLYAFRYYKRSYFTQPWLKLDIKFKWQICITASEENVLTLVFKYNHEACLY